MNNIHEVSIEFTGGEFITLYPNYVNLFETKWGVSISMDVNIDVPDGSSISRLSVYGNEYTNKSYSMIKAYNKLNGSEVVGIK